MKCIYCSEMAFDELYLILGYLVDDEAGGSLSLHSSCHNRYYYSLYI